MMDMMSEEAAWALSEECERDDYDPQPDRSRLTRDTKRRLAQHGLSEKAIQNVEARIATGELGYNGRWADLVRSLGLEATTEPLDLAFVEEPLTVTLEAETAARVWEQARAARKTPAQLIGEWARVAAASRGAAAG